MLFFCVIFFFVFFVVDIVFRSGGAESAEVTYGNFLVVLVPVRDYCNKNECIPAIAHDCFKIYKLFCHIWEMDVMYATSQNNKSAIKIDSKLFNRYESDPSKINFKYVWADLDFQKFAAAIKSVLEKSPRFYDGLILWYSTRGKVIRANNASGKYECTDSNGYGDTTVHSVESDLVLPQFNFLPRILLFDVRMCETDSDEQFESDPGMTVDIEAVKRQVMKDMNMNDEQYKHKMDELRKPIKTSHNAKYKNFAAFTSMAPIKIASNADGGSKFTQSIIAKFTHAKQNKQFIHQLLRSTELCYQSHFTQEQREASKLHDLVNFLDELACLG